MYSQQPSGALRLSGRESTVGLAHSGASMLAFGAATEASPPPRAVCACLLYHRGRCGSDAIQAIRGHPRLSEAIRSHPRPSEAGEALEVVSEAEEALEVVSLFDELLTLASWARGGRLRREAGQR